MSETDDAAVLILILRFRDLVNPQKGYTVDEHNKISDARGHTWWGWWRKPNESIPNGLWEQLKSQASEDGCRLLLLDSGEQLLYETRLLDISFSDDGELVPAPAGGHETPDYYQDVSDPSPFATWFKIGPIKEVSDTVLRELSYARLPHDEHVLVTEEQVLDRVIGHPTHLLNFGNVTYWVAKEAEEGATAAEPVYVVTPPPIAPKSILTATSNVILHISDLHYSTEHHNFEFGTGKFRTKLSDAIYRAVGGERPGVVVVSGDLTWEGTEEEFDLAFDGLMSLASMLGLSRHHFVIVPGNHDICWVPKGDADHTQEPEHDLVSEKHTKNYRAFFQRWYSRPPNETLTVARRFFVRGGPSLDFLGVSSCALQQYEGVFQGVGFVGVPGFREACQKFEWHENLRVSTRRILVLHHHLVPVVAAENPEGAQYGFGVALDAGQIREDALKYGVDLVLHGHQHQPFATAITPASFSAPADSKSVFVLGGGSAGVINQHLGPYSRRTLQLIEVKDDSLRIRLFDDGAGNNEFSEVSELLVGA